MALAAGSFTHMPVLPTLKYESKKSMKITIKCANNNKNKTKVVGKKPMGSTGSGGGGTGPKTEDGVLEPDPKTESGFLGPDPQTENPQTPINSDDDEDQLDNTFAFNLTGKEWVVIFLFLILFVGSTLFKAH
ncbi:hypothetical protein MtrunA17_Chr2g0315321 [Medicago truncatula]|uniref:Transmembrane protein, putative n=1 Tax=Medicago truncatula TaxID=3880 RepID=G7IR21_MEDTR|nr:uncharacterized protein LOC11426158 [Medicago truncatula]XP_039686623.1 uncharacterized protein LOC11426158 [Medicago truncatula]AES66542.1 transmembrane protein, putative [Medicago truncatula]RHN74898.1 hypothetical protein MtrunA17_Chr2g0315321 [Medicago truncatula]